MTEYKPLVSICSITYNHAPYIRECLDSFLMQKTDFPYEIIINDDCSTDGTTEIIKEYAEKYPDIIHPIFQDENQYQKGVRGMFQHFVIPRAKGKYIALCEGDDYWTDPLKLQKQVDFLESHPDYGMCYTKTKYFYQRLNKFGKENWGGPFTELDQLLIFNYCVPTASIVIRHSILSQYYESVKETTKWEMGDYPMSLYASGISKIYFMDECLCVYRVLPNSASHFNNINKALQFESSVFDVKKYYVKLFGKSSIYDDILNQYSLSCLRICLLHNDYSTSKNYKFKVNNLKLLLLKFFTSNKVLFSLMSLYLRRKN